MLYNILYISKFINDINRWDRIEIKNNYLLFTNKF